MKKPPNNLAIGHAFSYIFLYFSKYNDGETKMSELRETYNIMKYWMGKDTSESELKNILLETDEWLLSGSNMERLIAFDKLIVIIINDSRMNAAILNELYEDILRVACSNFKEFQEILNNNPHPNSLNLSKIQKNKLIETYPLIDEIQRKLGLV
jgi:hypothetical protein